MVHCRATNVINTLQTALSFQLETVSIAESLQNRQHAVHTRPILGRKWREEECGKGKRVSGDGGRKSKREMGRDERGGKDSVITGYDRSNEAAMPKISSTHLVILVENGHDRQRETGP